MLDLGCGRGRALIAWPSASRAAASSGSTSRRRRSRRARRGERARASTTSRFEVRDLSDFDVDAEPGAFDLVTTFDAVHDQARPGARCCATSAGRSRPDGVYLMQDINGSSHVARQPRPPARHVPLHDLRACTA